MTIFSRFSAFLLFVLSCFAVPAQAQVQVHFYSREISVQFPHAFIVVEGQLAGTGEKVSANYGFTAITISPTVLIMSAKGYVQAAKPDYIAKSNRQFTVTLDDAGYVKLMAQIAHWQNLKQPSYNIDRRNCIHFVMDIAETLGLKVNHQSKFFRKPRSFLQEVRALNPGVQ